MASDEEVQKARESLQKKRDKLAQANLDRQQQEQEVSNDLAMEQIRAEEARLDTALAQAKPSNKDVRESSSEAFDRAKAQQKAAEATAKAQDEGE